MKEKKPSAPRHWLVKSEPEAYAWADLVRDRRTAWTGVRNYQARIHLNTMQPGDHVLFLRERHHQSRRRPHCGHPGRLP